MSATAMGRLTRRRREAIRDPHTMLSAAQVKWLGILLLFAQFPQVLYVPLWVAGFGMMLVGLRLLLVRRDRARPDATPARIPSWALALFAIATGAALKASFGYLLGRDPCVAFLFVLAGIKFLETRTLRDATLLVCLASFLVLTPFFYSQSVLAAAIVLPALVALGVTLQVLAQPALRNLPLADFRAPARQTVKLFLQGIPLAALLFVLFPRLTGPLWGLPLDTATHSGLSDRMAPNTISELALSDAVAFRVDFNGAVPGKRERYWRGPVLSKFDGDEWTAGDRQAGGSVVTTGGTPVSYVVTLEPHGRRWLFALELPAAVPRVASDSAFGTTAAEVGILARDKELIAVAPVREPMRYTVTSILRASYPPDAETLAADISENTALPRSTRRDNPRTREFARELRERNPGDRDYVKSVIAWMKSQPFHYTLAPPPLPEHASVDAFLFDTQTGFCEHYASAFVLLLRAAGIPARVVTGYQGGEINPNGNYLIVRQSDAHAWAEALIDGQWRRFDPTGVVAPSRIDVGLGGALPIDDRVPLMARLDGGWVGNIELAWDGFNHDWRRHVIGFNYERQRELWREFGIDVLAGWQIVAFAAGALALWGAGMIGWLGWKKRHQDRAHWLWDSMCARLARAGLPREIHEGPIAYAARASLRWPEYAVAFRIIGDSYASVRYGLESVHSRSMALARLARAVDVLPTSAALRVAASA